MTNNESPSITALTPAELGAKLRQQREKKGLSIGEISERLKLPARQIEALENGEYAQLPEPVFVRGFLRSYGRFLDLDDDILNAALAHISPSNHVAHAGQTNLNFTNTQRKKPFPTWIFGIIAVAAIGYGIYAWQGKSQTENAKQEAETSTLPNNATASSVPNLPNATNVIVKPMTASDTQTQTASAPTDNNNVQAASSATTAVTGELVINARYRTMLTVTNAAGEVLINQIVPGRSEHRFQAGAPFEVRLGYAIGSTATFGGETINIDAARKGGKTAVFTAGGTESATTTP